MYDGQKLNEKDRGYLGGIMLRVGNLINTEPGHHGEFYIRSCCLRISLNETEVITHDLRRSQIDLAVAGKLVLELGTPLHMPDFGEHDMRLP